MTVHDILGRTIGFGSAPIGNMFRDIPDDEALATVEAAWNDGIRLFDTAPLYGAGLAEIRLGEVLSTKPRDEYLIAERSRPWFPSTCGASFARGASFTRMRRCRVTADRSAGGFDPILGWLERAG